MLALIQAGHAITHRLIVHLATRLFRGHLLLFKLHQRLTQLGLTLVRRGELDPRAEEVCRTARLDRCHRDAGDIELALDAPAVKAVFAQRGGELG